MSQQDSARLSKTQQDSQKLDLFTNKYAKTKFIFSLVFAKSVLQQKIFQSIMKTSLCLFARLPAFGFEVVNNNKTFPSSRM